jgi:hypothetical protein
MVFHPNMDPFMRFLVAAIVLCLLAHVGYTQPTQKFVMPKDLNVTAKDIVPPPSTRQFVYVPQPKSWFQEHFWALVIVVGPVVAAAVLGMLRRRK